MDTARAFEKDSLVVQQPYCHPDARFLWFYRYVHDLPHSHKKARKSNKRSARDTCNLVESRLILKRFDQTHCSLDRFTVLDRFYHMLEWNT
jgi:hypothetical protein